MPSPRTPTWLFEKWLGNLTIGRLVKGCPTSRTLLFPFGYSGSTTLLPASSSEGGWVGVPTST